MEPDLIEEYVGALHTRLAWRPDARDIADEVADHLRERAESLVAQGSTPVAAQRRTLSSFGEVLDVARQFAENDAQALAVPTASTRRAGLAGLAAAAAWVASGVVAATGGHTDLLIQWSLPRYEIWVVLLVLAVGLTTITLTGVLARTGRLTTPGGIITVAVGSLLAVGMLAAGWAVTVLAGALGLAVLAAVRDCGPPTGVVRPVRALAVWLLGGAALVFFDEVVPVGPVDEYGDHQVAWLVPFLVCALTSAVVLAVVGLRLRAEPPADLGPTGPREPLLV